MYKSGQPEHVKENQYKQFWDKFRGQVTVDKTIVWDDLVWEMEWDPEWQNAAKTTSLTLKFWLPE